MRASLLRRLLFWASELRYCGGRERSCFARILRAVVR